MKSLPAIFIESLIPSGALLGVLFAFHLRNQPTSFRGAMLWLALLVGTIGLPIWLEQWAPFSEPLAIASLSIPAFVCPPCVHYWLRFERLSAPRHVVFAKTLVVVFLILLGILWTLLVWAISGAVIRKVWDSFF